MGRRIGFIECAGIHNFASFPGKDRHSATRNLDTYGYHIRMCLELVTGNMEIVYRVFIITKIPDCLSLSYEIPVSPSPKEKLNAAARGPARMAHTRMPTSIHSRLPANVICGLFRLLCDLKNVIHQGIDVGCLERDPVATFPL
jgi:hypothetical protein